MTDRQSPGAWLVQANKDWEQRAKAEKMRADSAERFLLAETTEKVRLAKSRQLWRRLTIYAWCYFGGYTAIVDLHWSRWTYIGSGLAAATVTAIVETAEQRRARRKAASR